MDAISLDAQGFGAGLAINARSPAIAWNLLSMNLRACFPQLRNAAAFRGIDWRSCPWALLSAVGCFSAERLRRRYRVIIQSSGIVMVLPNGNPRGCSFRSGQLIAPTRKGGE
jgi:hypothetical protein